MVETSGEGLGGLLEEEFAIQMVTISRWILPVTSATPGRTRTLTSLRTPNSDRKSVV
jgi:hypothetical protein